MSILWHVNVIFQVGTATYMCSFAKSTFLEGKIAVKTKTAKKHDNIGLFCSIWKRQCQFRELVKMCGPKVQLSLIC